VPRYKTHARRQGGQKVRLGTATGCPPKSKPNDFLASSGKADILAMGIETFNEACRDFRAPLHQGVGGSTSTRAGPLGVDFEKRLTRTLDLPYMGERHVGVQAVARQGPDLPGLQRLLPYCWRWRDPRCPTTSCGMDDDRSTPTGRTRPSPVRFKLGDRRVDSRLDHTTPWDAARRTWPSRSAPTSRT